MIRYFKKNKIKLFFWIGVFLFIVAVISGTLGKSGITSIQPEESRGAFAIFLNNMKVGMSMLFLGAISGGIYGMAILCLNGYIAGELIQYLLGNDKADMVALGLLPHMGMEVFGLALFAAIGCVPAAELVKWLRLRENYKRKEITGVLKDMMKGGAIGTLLLLTASLIEAYISCVS